MRVVTVTANAAVDTLHVLDRLERGAINRVSRTVAVPGGKGNNVARVLVTLGHAVVATGFVGGRSGAFIEAGLRGRGIEPRFVAVDGESRVCLTLLEPETGTITEIREPGFAVPPEAADRLLAVVVAAARDADAVVVSGSLPPGLPADCPATLLAALRPSPAFVALDAGGDALRLGLAGKPDLIAPNAAEMAALMGRDDAAPEIGPETMIAFARRDLIGAALPAEARVVLTLGRRGAALVSRHGAFVAAPPPVAAVNPVGSGDALLAGFLDARSRGGGDGDAIAAAVAVGTAAALRETIGEVRPEDVDRIRRGVRVDRVAS